MDSPPIPQAGGWGGCWHNASVSPRKNAWNLDLSRFQLFRAWLGVTFLWAEVLWIWIRRFWYFDPGQWSLIEWLTLICARWWPAHQTDITLSLAFFICVFLFVWLKSINNRILGIYKANFTEGLSLLVSISRLLCYWFYLGHFALGQWPGDL